MRTRRGFFWEIFPFSANHALRGTKEERVYDYNSMSITQLRFLRAACVLTIAGFVFAGFASAQESSPSLEKKSIDLKKKEIELKEKEIDLAKKQSELEQLKDQLKYQETAQSISINLQGDVLFDFNKAVIRPEAEPSLERVAAVVGAFPEGKVTITGYSDSKGGTKENLALSRERAVAVKDWLVKKKNLPADNITTDGQGEENPVAPNKNPDGTDNPSGRAQNRRVQITVQK